MEGQPIFIIILGLMLALLGFISLRHSLRVMKLKTHKVEAKIINFIKKKEKVNDGDGYTKNVTRYYSTFEFNHPVTKESITFDDPQPKQRKPKLNSISILSIKIKEDGSLDIQSSRFMNTFLLPFILFSCGVILVIGGIIQL